MPPPSQSTHSGGPGQYASSVISDGTDGVVVGGPDVNDWQLLIGSSAGSCVERVTASDRFSELITGYQITRVGRGGRPEGTRRTCTTRLDSGQSEEAECNLSNN